MSVTGKVTGASAAGEAGAAVHKHDYPVSASIVIGLWMLLDFASTLLAGFASLYVLIDRRAGVGVEWRAAVEEYYISAICFMALATFLLAHFGGLYRFGAIVRPFAYLDNIMIVFATAFLLLLALAFSLKVSEVFSRIWMYSFALSACGATIAFRVAGSAVLHRLAANGVAVRNVAIVGGGEQGRRFLRFMGSSSQPFVRIIGVFDDRLRRIGPEVEGHPLLGSIDELVRRSRRDRIDDVVIALPWSADRRIAEIVERLHELPVNIHLSSDLAGFSLNYHRPPSHFEHVPIVEVTGTPLSGWNVVWKSIEDRLLAGLILAAFLPVMAAVAIAIKLESRGPVLFRQRRYGFNNQMFYVYKFRSMHYQPETADSAVQAVRGDPRVTRVGRFIRRTSLDELPQLLNVLNGTMSLVGPRPHPVNLDEAFSKRIRGYFARHRVKPGITGWAQVNGWRGETDTLDKMEARVRHDVYYMEHWSVLFDLKILAMTAVVILTGKNAY